MQELTSGWLGYLTLLWVVVTVLWMILLAYRSMLASREEDQLFLNKGEAHAADDMHALVGKLDKLTKPIWTLGILAGALVVLIVCLWIWRGMKAGTMV